jgi:hypothetical protein
MQVCWPKRVKAVVVHKTSLQLFVLGCDASEQLLAPRNRYWARSIARSCSVCKEGSHAGGGFLVGDVQADADGDAEHAVTVDAVAQHAANLLEVGGNMRKVNDA